MPHAVTSTLKIEFEEYGSANGWPVVLSHGFPYSPEAYTEVLPLLIETGARVIVPCLRGFGGTRFLSSQQVRTGQQAALACDLAELLQALKISGVILAGFDWGGLASCTAAALFPERIAGLVCYGGYDILDIRASQIPLQPRLEKAFWYQHMFQTERGKQCLASYRGEVARTLWSEWSPGWTIPKHRLEITIQALESPDFVEVAASHYRYAFGNLPSDAIYEELEQRLAEKPAILVPTVTVDGTKDPLKPGGTTASCQGKFRGRHEHWSLDIGHAFPMEAPKDFARAVLKVHEWVLMSSSQ